MRLLMLGTGPFAVPTFHSLLDSDHDVSVLVTRPTPPVRSRGKPPRNPMREAAESRNVEILAPDDINTDAARTQLASLRPDLLVVCDYGQILSNESLSVARLGGINLHGSLLPKYRGAAPVQWAIHSGDTETGVTVIHMTPKLDGGPCLTQRTTAIGADETAAELEPRLSELGVDAVHEAIRMLETWDGVATIGTTQDGSLVSKAPRLKKSDGLVDWSNSAEQIQNQVRAFQPWPGSYTEWNRGKGQPVRLILDRVRVLNAETGEPPGTVLQAEAGAFRIATGDGVLAIDRIQPAGKRVMEIDEFLRGNPPKAGDALG